MTIASFLNPHRRVRSKQNKYPVLFLTQGVNTKYEDYRDPRTWSIPMAAKFVDMAEIFGINAFSEDILRDSSQVAMVKNRGQILFVWMDEKGCAPSVTVTLF